MGCTVKAISFVGNSFKNESEAIAFFQSKITMSKMDLDEMGPHLIYWLEPRIKKGFPTCGLYSIFNGDENCGFYIGYPIYDSNPYKMITNIEKASKSWTELFKENPQVIQEVLYT